MKKALSRTSANDPEYYPTEAPKTQANDGKPNNQAHNHVSQHGNGGEHGADGTSNSNKNNEQHDANNVGKSNAGHKDTKKDNQLKFTPKVNTLKVST